MWPRRFAVATLACLLSAGSAAAAPPATPPNVVLITVDTLRADRLGAYGSRLHTPRIDRLAAEGCVFEQAVSPMPVTRPSHFSMFTARYPREHGVVHNDVALPPTIPTVTEAFDAAGYETAGFTAVALLDRGSGAARGFDAFSSPTGTHGEDAEAVIPRVVAWLRGRTAKAPFFLWVHLFDPHMPYAPAASFAPPSPPEVAALLPEASWDLLLERARANGGNLPAPLYERALGLYDGEVAQTDHWVGVLLDALAAAGALDGAAVVFTADHGECFEHGIFFNHTNCLYQGAVRVPLIVRAPPLVRPGERRGDVVELVDLPRTLLHLTGLPSGGFRGRALFDPAQPVAAYAVTEHPRLNARQMSGREPKSTQMSAVAGQPVHWPSMRDEHYALHEQSWKYLYVAKREELYDLASDPGESRNLAATQPERVARMRAQLREWLQVHPARASNPGPVDESLREILRALGYSD